MALGRNYVLAGVAIAGIIVLILIGVGMRSVTLKTGYARINISDKSAVYLEFKGTELRAATSVEGLKTAEPVALGARSEQVVQSPEFALPIPADQLPEGVGAVKGSFTRIANNLSGDLGICRTDEQRIVWQCNVHVWSTVGPDPGAAQAIQLPKVEKLALAVTGAPSKGRLGVGVRLAAGSNQVTGVRRDGKPVLVQVRVTDAGGDEVGAKKGPLADFAFS
jgi:hypothetical protein